MKRWHGVIAFVLIAAALLVLLRFSMKPEGCNQRDDSCAVGCP
jgi:hypothetical protein